MHCFESVTIQVIYVDEVMYVFNDKYAYVDML